MAGETYLPTQCDLKSLDNRGDTKIANYSEKSIGNHRFCTTPNTEESDESPRVIYFNPNYGVKKHVIHYNPKVHAQPQIRVNPQLDTQTISQSDSKHGYTQPSIHVNPKIVKNIDVMQHLQREKSRISNSVENSKSDTSQEKVQKSVYVNPKLMQKLTSTESMKNLGLAEKVVLAGNSDSVFPKSNAKHVIANDSSNSKLVPLSSRKLVRVKRTSKGSPGTIVSPTKVRQFSGTALKITRIKENNMMLSKGSPATIVSPTKERQFSGTALKITRIRENNLVPPVSCSDSTNSLFKSSKSKIVGSHFTSVRPVFLKGKSRSPRIAKTKTLSNTMKLVSIGGISYKSSTNRLVRRTSTSPLKKKRIISSKLPDQFFIASNGKTLRRLNTKKPYRISVNSTKIAFNLNGSTSLGRTPSGLLKQNMRSSISNKVKQRSIQILRNKMRKNNQPCLFFQKFGYCANQAKGSCHKVHDKKQIVLCKNFLQGKCLLEGCKLSHDVGPEKMPTCRYFLEGCCNRDACPYLHVKVSENNPICRSFLQGYCEKGNECKLRHMYACPEFEKTGNCSKGKQCPYPHKSKAPKISCSMQKRKKTTAPKAPDSTESTSYSVENRKRYYDNTEDLERRRDRLLRNLQIIKAVQGSQSNQGNEITVTENCSETSKNDNLEFERPKRPPIGTLPSYIPIN